MEAKVADFLPELQDAAKSAKLLSHPAKLEIIRLLLKQKNCLTGDISKDLPLSRTSVFQHLTALKDAGWVKGDIVGARIGYCLDLDVIKRDVRELRSFLEDCNNSPGPCC